MVPMKDHPHHFQYQNGTCVWWFGETGWALFTNSDEEAHNRKTVFAYLDKRAKQGFNAMHCHFISEADWGTTAECRLRC